MIKPAISLVKPVAADLKRARKALKAASRLHDFAIKVFNPDRTSEEKGDVFTVFSGKQSIGIVAYQFHKLLQPLPYMDVYFLSWGRTPGDMARGLTLMLDRRDLPACDVVQIAVAKKDKPSMRIVRSLHPGRECPFKRKRGRTYEEWVIFFLRLP